VATTLGALDPKAKGPKLLPVIKRLHKASDCVYGSPKIQVDLKEEGYLLN